MNFRYSRNYFPPVPTVELTLITAAEFLHIGPLQAIVDSGADGTIVPINYLKEIQAPPTVEMIIRSQWGEKRNVLLYLVDVQIADLTLPGVEVVGDELSDEVVLGRDILNLLRVLLDGPHEVVEVSE